MGFLVTMVVVISVLLTHIVSVTIGYQNQNKALIDNSLEMNRINAEKLAITTDNILQSLTSSLSVTSEYLSSDIKGTNNQMKIDLVRQSNSNFNSVFIADQEGVVTASSPSHIGVVGNQLTSIGATQALQERKALISEPYVALTERLIILISHPIIDQAGNYLGFVGGTVYLHEENVFGTLLGKFHIVRVVHIFMLYQTKAI